MQSYINDNKDRFLKELIELLKIPSVSADPQYANDVNDCAKWVSQSLKKAGADNVEICETAGYPIVYGEKMVDPKLPTVLVYGHYDVQPPDPVELWKSEPFEPVVETYPEHPEGAIVARGAADDKGQFFMHLKALEVMLNSNELPCNVKFMIEGEEEVGSENLEIFVKENKEKLEADVVLVSDTSMIGNDTPSITVGLRGMSYVEVEVTGPKRDLHSGVYGGGVANPINVLSKMIGSLQDEDNRITIEGFYDNVVELSDADKAFIAKIPFNQNEYNQELNIAKEQGEKGYSTLERTSTRPTLDVNGMWGGYIGEGAKTVLPSKAYAKISMRLVPNQTPEEITEKFTKHFNKIAPESVTVKVTPHHGGVPAVVPTDSDEYRAAAKAMEATFGKTPIAARSGGSIPIVALFEKELQIKTVLLGFGLDSDGIHSPNERFGLFNFYKGIETIPYFFKYYTEMKTK